MAGAAHRSTLPTARAEGVVSGPNRRLVDPRPASDAVSRHDRRLPVLPYCTSARERACRGTQPCAPTGTQSAVAAGPRACSSFR